MADNTTRVSSYDEFKQVMADKRGFIVAGWNGDPAVEARIKEETKATIRVIPMGEPGEAPCIVTGEKGREVVLRPGVLSRATPGRTVDGPARAPSYSSR